MKTLFLNLTVLSFLLIACKNNKKEVAETNTPVTAAESFLVTDSTWGLVSASMNFEDLKKVYGENNIKDETICGAECIDSIDVTKLYPGQKNEAVIYWDMDAYHKRIGTIRCTSQGSDWYTPDSLRVGSSFSDLLRVNGQKITFMGFGWDYGGAITLYSGGSIENSRIRYELDMKPGDGNEVMGDSEFDSSMPEVQKNIGRIFINCIYLNVAKENQ